MPGRVVKVVKKAALSKGGSELFAVTVYLSASVGRVVPHLLQAGMCRL